MPNFKLAKLAPLLFFSFFIPSLILFSAKISSAQEGRSEISGKIEIKNVKIQKGATEVKIEGVLFNSSKDTVTPDITHLLILGTIDPLIKPKNEIYEMPSLIVSADEGKNYFSLKPNEQKSFSYVLPISPYVPQANYYLYLGFIRSNGQTEASYEDVVEKLGSSQKDGFLAFDQESCFLLNKEGKKFGNNAGPAFLPEESPEARCLVKNIGDKEIEVSSRVLWKEVYVYGNPSDGTVATENQEQKITFKPGETKLVNLSIPKAEKPQTYQSLWSFEDKDGKSRSFNMFFRWTISGESARVKNVIQASEIKESYAKGEKISLSVDYFGSSDLFWAGDEQNVSELKELKMKAVIKDGEGNICGEKEESIDNISDGGEKNKIIEIALNKKCKDISYAVSLSSSQKELAQESGKLPKVLKKDDILPYLYFGIPSLIFAMLIFVFFRKRKITPINLIVALIASITLASGVALAATTKEYPDGSGQVYTFKWGGDWQKLTTGTDKLYSYINSSNINHLRVYDTFVDFSDYYDNTDDDYLDVFVDYRAVDSSCVNTAMFVQIEMFINSDGMPKTQIEFRKKGSDESFRQKYEVQYNNNGSSHLMTRWFRIKRSDIEAFYKADGTPKGDNPILTMEVKQIGYNSSTGKYFRGYFNSADNIERTKSDAFNASDIIRIKVPIKIPDPSVSLHAVPSTSTFPSNSTTLAWSSDDIENCTASSSYGNWTGSKSVSGSATISNLWQGRNGLNSNETHTFTLKCFRTIGDQTYTYQTSQTVTATKPTIMRTLTIQKAFGSKDGGVRITRLSDNQYFTNAPFKPLAESKDENKNNNWMTNVANYFTGVAEAGGKNSLVNANKKLAFVFDPLLECIFSISKSSCSFELPEGFYVELVADALSAADIELLSCSSGNVCVFKMDSNKTVVVDFKSPLSSSSSSSSSSLSSSSSSVGGCNNDDVQNNGETGIDCGGGGCGPCVSNPDLKINISGNCTGYIYNKERGDSTSATKIYSGYSSGDEVTLTATNGAYSGISCKMTGGWNTSSGGNCAGGTLQTSGGGTTNDTCNFTMGGSDRSLTVSFDESSSSSSSSSGASSSSSSSSSSVTTSSSSSSSSSEGCCGGGGLSHDLIVEIIGEGKVTVTGGGNTFVCESAECKWPYDQGSSLELTATPESGWSFSNWSGDCLKTGNKCNINNIQSPKTITVTFTESSVTSSSSSSEDASSSSSSKSSMPAVWIIEI